MRFKDLPPSLDLYFEGCRVIIAEVDLRFSSSDLRRAYEPGAIGAEFFMGPHRTPERVMRDKPQHGQPRLKALILV